MAPEGADPLRGALLISAAALLMASLGGLVKSISTQLPIDTIVFYRSLFGLLLLLPWVLRHGPRGLATPVVHLHLLRGLFGVCAMYGYFFTLARIPLAQAVLLTFSAPLFIPFVARLWVGELLTPRIIAATGAGFAGIALILRPGATLFAEAALVGVLSAMMAACAMVTLRQLALHREPALRTVFYFALISTLVSALPVVLHWRLPPYALWPQLALIALLAIGGQILLTRGYACAPAAKVAPFSYLAAVFSAAYGWLYWDELPDTLTAAGALLVVLAGILAVRARAAAPSPRPIMTVSVAKVTPDER